MVIPYQIEDCNFADLWSESSFLHGVSLSLPEPRLINYGLTYVHRELVTWVLQYDD